MLYISLIAISDYSDDLEQYADLFLQHNITGKRLLRMTHADIEKLGISSYGHILDLSVSYEYHLMGISCIFL